MSISSKTSVGHAIDGREHRLDGERHPRQLAAGGDLAQRAGLLAGVGREEHLDAVGARFGGSWRSRIVAQLAGFDRDRQPGAAEPQGLEPSLDGPGEVLGDLLAGGSSARQLPFQGGPGFGQGRVEGQQVGLVASIRASLASVAARRSSQLVGRAVEPRGQPAVEGQSRSRRPRAAPGRRPSLRRGRGGRRRPRASRRPAVRARLTASASSATALSERLERPRHPRQEPLRRAVGLVEQGVTLGGGRADLVGVRSRLRLASQLVVLASLSGRRRPARRARIPAAPARARGASAESISSCRFRRSVSWACRASAVGGDAGRRARRRRRAARAAGRGPAGRGPRAGRGCRPAVAQLLERGQGDRQSVDRRRCRGPAPRSAG